jgi:hypothetical protein
MKLPFRNTKSMVSFKTLRTYHAAASGNRSPSAVSWTRVSLSVLGRPAAPKKTLGGRSSANRNSDRDSPIHCQQVKPKSADPIPRSTV